MLELTQSHVEHGLRMQTRELAYLWRAYLTRRPAGGRQGPALHVNSSLMQTFLFSNVVPARQCTCTYLPATVSLTTVIAFIQLCTCAPMYLSKEAVALGSLCAALYRHACVLAWSSGPVCRPVPTRLCTCLEQWPCQSPCTGTPACLPGAVALYANLY